MKERKFYKFKIDKSLLRVLSKLSRGHVLLRMFVILIIYGVCAIIVVAPNLHYTALILCPFMGFILSGFLNAAHDCIHCTQFKSKKVNRIMGMLWCAPIFVNYTIYRYQHLTHHRYTGVKGDTESRRIYHSIKAYFYSLTGIDFWRHVIKVTIKSAKDNFPSTINNDQRCTDVKKDNRVLFFWLIWSIILTVFFPKIILLVYWLPMLFYAPIVILTSLPEHYGCSEGSDIRYNTRSIVTNRFIRFFLWNGNYHAEHHAYPGVPAMHLHHLHKEISNQLYMQEKSYVMFHLKLLKELIKKHYYLMKEAK